MLAPTAILITETMIAAAEKAYFAKSNALAADEKQTAECPEGEPREGWTRTRSDWHAGGAARAANSGFLAWPSLLSTSMTPTTTMDATAKFTERPERGVKDRDRSSLARAFGAESGVMVVHARTQGATPPMKRLISKVAARLLSTTLVGDVGPFRGCFYPEELRFAVPTRAVAKVITECIIKTKMQLAVFSAEPTREHGDAAPVGMGRHGAYDDARPYR